MNLAVYLAVLAQDADTVPATAPARGSSLPRRIPSHRFEWCSRRCWLRTPWRQRALSTQLQVFAPRAAPDGAGPGLPTDLPQGSTRICQPPTAPAAAAGLRSCMAEFTIRSESVDVEQIMKQIRQRILEKRGADYTEDQIRELASVRLEKFLDPKNLRSDLLEQFRKSRPAISTEPPAIKPPYTSTIRRSSRRIAAPLRFIRRLLHADPEAVLQPEHAATRSCTRRRSSTSTC